MLALRIVSILLLILAVYHVDTARGIARYRRKVCDYKRKADVVFALDSSDGQDYKWSAQRKMVRRVISILRFGPRRFRFGLVTFDRTARTHFTLNQFTKVRLIKMKLNHKYLKKSKFPESRIDLAMSLIANSSFSKQSGARPNAPKLVVMLLNRDVTDYGPIRRESVRFREQGGRVILVTMGLASADNHNTLAKALVAREHIYTHYTLKHLENANKRIAMAMCKASKLTKRQLDNGANPISLYAPKPPVIRKHKYGPHMQAVMRIGTLEVKGNAAAASVNSGQQGSAEVSLYRDSDEWTEHGDTAGGATTTSNGRRTDAVVGEEMPVNDGPAVARAKVNRGQSRRRLKNRKRKTSTRRGKKGKHVSKLSCEARIAVTDKIDLKKFTRCMENLRLVVVVKNMSKAALEGVHRMLQPIWKLVTSSSDASGIVVVTPCGIHRYTGSVPMLSCPFSTRAAQPHPDRTPICHTGAGSAILLLSEIGGVATQLSTSATRPRVVIVYVNNVPFDNSLNSMHWLLYHFMSWKLERDHLVIPVHVGSDWRTKSEMQAIATDPTLPTLRANSYAKLGAAKHSRKLMARICHLDKNTKRVKWAGRVTEPNRTTTPLSDAAK